MLTNNNLRLALTADHQKSTEPKPQSKTKVPAVTGIATLEIRSGALTLKDARPSFPPRIAANLNWHVWRDPNPSVELTLPVYPASLGDRMSTCAITSPSSMYARGKLAVIVPARGGVGNYFEAVNRYK